MSCQVMVPSRAWKAMYTGRTLPTSLAATSSTRPGGRCAFHKPVGHHRRHDDITGPSPRPRSRRVDAIGASRGQSADGPAPERVGDRPLTMYQPRHPPHLECGRNASESLEFTSHFDFILMERGVGTALVWPLGRLEGRVPSIDRPPRSLDHGSPGCALDLRAALPSLLGAPSVPDLAADCDLARRPVPHRGMRIQCSRVDPD